MLSELEKELEKLSNQARFVKEIIDGKLVVSKKKKVALVQELQARGYKPFPKVIEATKDGELEAVLENDEALEDEKIGASDYDYLLGVSLLFVVIAFHC
jgi:DNA topoisomerase-2